MTIASTKARTSGPKINRPWFTCLYSTLPLATAHRCSLPFWMPLKLVITGPTDVGTELTIRKTAHRLQVSARSDFQGATSRSTLRSFVAQGSRLMIYPGRRNANQPVTFFTCHQTAELASYFSAEQTSNLDRRVIRYAHQ